VPYPWQQTALLAEHGSGFLQEVAGAVVVGGIVADAVLDVLAQRGIPVVVAGGHVYHSPINSVAPDYQYGAYQLTRHLLTLGHRRIALLPGPPVSHTSAEKLAGFLLAHAEHGIAAPPDLIRGSGEHDSFNLGAARDLTAALLDSPQPPTAIVYATDNMARAGLETCLRRGIAVPGQLSIAAFHDDTAARDATPALTTIRIDRSLSGAAATGRLHELISGGAVAPVTRQMLPVELVVRDSVAPPRDAGLHTYHR
jgi:DNA-binding LacI/PurR family transcriptional regulator